MAVSFWKEDLIVICHQNFHNRYYSAGRKKKTQKPVAYVKLLIAMYVAAVKIWAHFDKAAMDTWNVLIFL